MPKGLGCDVLCELYARSAAPSARARLDATAAHLMETPRYAVLMDLARSAPCGPLDSGATAGQAVAGSAAARRLSCSTALEPQEARHDRRSDLAYCPRTKLAPTLSVSRRRVEDGDDFLPIFQSQSELRTARRRLLPRGNY